MEVGDGRAREDSITTMDAAIASEMVLRIREWLAEPGSPSSEEPVCSVSVSSCVGMAPSRASGYTYMALDAWRCRNSRTAGSSDKPGITSTSCRNFCSWSFRRLRNSGFRSRQQNVLGGWRKQWSHGQCTDDLLGETVTITASPHQRRQAVAALEAQAARRRRRQDTPKGQCCRWVRYRRARPFACGGTNLKRSLSNSLKRRSTVQWRLPVCTCSSNCANESSNTRYLMMDVVK